MNMWLYSLFIRRHDLLSITLYWGMIRAGSHQPFQKQQFTFENMIRARVRLPRVSVDTLFLRNVYFENQCQHALAFVFHNFDDLSCYAANKQADMAVRKKIFDVRQQKLRNVAATNVQKACHNHLFNTSAAQQRAMAVFIKACVCSG